LPQRLPPTRRISRSFGYEKHLSFTHESKNVTIKTFFELGCALRDEYQAYLSVLEQSSKYVEPGDEDIPF
jgi:hypothetical protein